MKSKNYPFVHLHLHSNYSLCRGGNTLQELCTALREQGHTAFALTEVDGLYGLIWASQQAQAAGLRLITGAEIRDRRHRAVLLARNRRGYENMCQLLSRKHAGNKVNGSPPFDLPGALARYRQGLVVLSDSPEILQRLRRDGRDDLYVLCVPGPDRRRQLALARQLELPPVASNDVYFVAPEDFRTHRLLRAIDCNTALSRVPPGELARPDGWLKAPAEMWAAFPEAPEALENTVRIAARCTFSPRKTWDIFPKFPTPRGESEMTCLRRLCAEGIKWRYGVDLEARPGAALVGRAAAIRARLEKELGIIAMKGFATYFLVTRDIVQHATHTCGRGSAAASLVSYVLGITHVDPIRYNLFFERFLHLGREDPPDIDVDFAWDERDDILDYIFAKYGAAHTAMIANHVCFKARAALREIAKCYGLPDAEIGKMTKRLSGYSMRSIVETVRTHPMFHGIELYDPWPAIITLADRLTGFPRHLSVHCGGVVITPDPVDHHIPVQEAAKGVQIVQVEKDQAEALGLVKLDILGNRSLAVIRDAVTAVYRNTGHQLDFNHIKPEDDPATQTLIRTGDTIGVFYVESPAMRLLQQKAKTGDFERLVVHSSIIRPASNQFIREYIRRLHGGAYEPLHPLLENILAETFGILSYQEDISRVAMALADFDAAEADGLRKVFSRKNNELLLVHYRKRFFDGAQRKGVAREVIEKVWEMILSFSGYSFCKPHSASYALVSYKSAYLRAHHPAEFMAAVISNQGGYYRTFAYISEAKRMGLQVLPVDVNASMRAYTGHGRTLRTGFMQLKGFRDGAIEAILAARAQGGPFISFDAFRQRVDLEPAAQEILIKAGAFDSLEGQQARPHLLWNVLRRRARERIAAEKETRQPSLFEAPARPVSAAKLPPFSPNAILYHELETLGFLLSRHPLTLYRHALKRYRTVPAKDLRRHVGRRVQTIGWHVTGKLVRTKKDQPMEFISFEDTTAIYETTFFPKVYERCCHLLTRNQPFILTGKVEEDYGAITLTVEDLQVLREGESQKVF